VAIKVYALTTVSRLKTFLEISGTSYDTLLEWIANSATEFIENYCHRRFQRTAYTQEMYSTDKWQKTLLLDNFPVISTETFTLEIRTSGLNEDDWDTVDSEDYHVDYDGGIIRMAGRIEFQKGVDKYRVTYTAGYDFDTSTKPLSDTEAGDLEMAMWKLCAVMFNRRRGDPGIRSERIGDYSVTYAKTVYESPEIKEILDKYKRKDVALGVETPYLT